MRKILFLIVLFPYLSTAQDLKDTLSFEKTYPETTEGIRFTPKQLIVPGVLLAAGIYGTMDKRLDHQVQDRAAQWGGDTFVDDILPIVSPTAVYVLNWCNVRGKHNFVDRTVIIGTAAVLTVGSVYLLKSTTSVTRPDGSGDDSFPSMHTAIAFAGAEFLRQEYEDRSVWYGVAGYTLAAGTGFLRIYNNKHWLSDVLAGAGIGILTTKAAYWLYPEIRKVYAGTKLDHALIIPWGNTRTLGLSLSVVF